MSSNKKKPNVNFVIDKKEFLAGLQALTIYCEDKTNTYIAIRDDLGEDHPATQQLLEEVSTVSDILNYFSTIIKSQNDGSGEHFN